MKHFYSKIVFYFRKFGFGIFFEKMPLIYPYKYKLTIQFTWIECCFFVHKRNFNGRYQP